ncbi:ImmA/IrrE family metallo-endopeptidase [Streptomyces sp. NBC_00588]|uniref:ImmA/IrrE family metallo-endopeptidase n=1 Tax=Streptomyces sp. NBC_00588 TaxID=2975784 RepID=UPI002E81ED6E|nr:ImmA/IrrE family metallo-endopeptidase [Streptomyces sp. NBC_00588]WUB35914.1 ImmA/IrrE family metallo-endopeptidase [Streptomyces sp. NBC_00588]
MIDDPYWAWLKENTGQGKNSPSDIQPRTSARLFTGDFEAAIEAVFRMRDEFLGDYPGDLSNPKGSDALMWDIDGYLDPTNEPPSITVPTTTPIDVDPYDLATLHFLLRSSVVLGEDIDTEGITHFRAFSEQCARQAHFMLMTRQDLPVPVWVRELGNSLKSSGVASTAVVDKITISTTLRSQIYAYSYPARHRIEVSAVSREHLRTVNLILCSVSSRMLDPRTRSNSLETGRSVVDFLLPYVFSLYFPRVNYSSLPIPRARNAEVFSVAHRAAQVQAKFLLAHEYAHILKHENRKPGRELELEADNFAYDLLFDYPEFGESDDSYLIYMSAKWLFLYLSLDRIVGAVLSDYDIDWIDLPIRNRDAILIPRVSKVKGTMEQQALQQMGDILLFNAKHALKMRGTDWIKSAAREFELRHCF